MRGLDPRIHHSSQESSEGMDGRVKPGHDDNVVTTRESG
jgi:hypothetical protein